MCSGSDVTNAADLGMAVCHLQPLSLSPPLSLCV